MLSLNCSSGLARMADLAAQQLARWESFGRALNVTLNAAIQSYAEPILDNYQKGIERLVKFIKFLFSPIF